MPDIKVDQYTDSDRAKNKSEKLERIVTALDGHSKMDMQIPQGS